MNSIEDYRTQVLYVLKATNNYYDTEEVSIGLPSWNFKYARWLHPYQGDWEVRSLFTEEILRNLSKLINPDSTVLDIGAQTGNMAVAYSLFADKVLAFEPNPAAYEVLYKNSKINDNIIPFNYAISDEEGPLLFHYSDNGFCNGGFATRTKAGIGVTGHRVPIEVWGINLEKFLEQEEIKIKNLSLIKIDAEGHDRFILRTLKNIIQKYKPVIITEIYNGLYVDEIDDLINVLHSFNYKVYDEEHSKGNINNLGTEIKSSSDINPHSGHNLICFYDS